MDARSGLEDYLDHLFAPLIPVVPYETRRDLRREARLHLEALIASYQEMGCGSREALAEATMQFGDPRILSLEWKKEYQSHNAVECEEERWEDDSKISDSILPSFVLSFLSYSILLSYVWLQCAQPILDGIPPTVDLFSTVFFFTCFLGFVPGFTVGALFPKRGTQGASLSLSILIAFISCAYLSQKQEGIAFIFNLTLLPFIAWLPIGWFASKIGASFRRMMRRLDERLTKKPYKMVCN